MTNINKVPREIIQGKLLAALDDKNKVALVLDEKDLKDLINAAEKGGLPEIFVNDLKNLRHQAFGE